MSGAANAPNLPFMNFQGSDLGLCKSVETPTNLRE